MRINVLIKIFTILVMCFSLACHHVAETKEIEISMTDSLKTNKSELFYIEFKNISFLDLDTNYFLSAKNKTSKIIYFLNDTIEKEIFKILSSSNLDSVYCFATHKIGFDRFDFYNDLYWLDKATGGDNGYRRMVSKTNNFIMIGGKTIPVIFQMDYQLIHRKGSPRVQHFNPILTMKVNSTTEEDNSKIIFLPGVTIER